MSEERKAKMRGPRGPLGYKRKSRYHSDETKAKIGKSNSISQLGLKQSEETKTKRSKTITEWWSIRKQKEYVSL